MTIPKVLRGKKAEKLSQMLCFMTLDNEPPFEAASLESLMKYNQIVTRFYDTDFTPDKIELFEGWEKKALDWFHQSSSAAYIHLSKRNKGYGLTTIYDGVKPITWVNGCILTLGDFISACNNSNIELTFKKEK